MLCSFEEKVEYDQELMKKWTWKQFLLLPYVFH
jgi:hypothetical protein